MRTANQMLKDENLTPEDFFLNGIEEKIESYGRRCMIEGVRAAYEHIHYGKPSSELTEEIMKPTVIEPQPEAWDK